jgi:hypothetical protein
LVADESHAQAAAEGEHEQTVIRFPSVVPQTMR